MGGTLQVFEGDATKRYHLLGIKVLGNSCKDKQPGVYLQIAPYLDWIEDIVWPIS